MDRIPALHRRIKELSGTKIQPGTIVSYTTIHHPPAGFGTHPYRVALIEFDNGSKVCAQLTADGLEPMIGARVVPHMRRVRTMANGLHVNDFKYEVVESVTEPMLKIQHYVLALSGPSGVGKTTITRSLLKLFHVDTEQLPMYTTCAKRKEEKEPLMHVSDKKFHAMIERGEIIAHTVMQSQEGKCGYRKIDIEKLWTDGKLPVVIADINLLKGLAETLGRRSVLSCGLLPPGVSRRRMLSALLHRLRGRGSETEQEIKERLKGAETDLDAFKTHSHLFDHVLVNDKLDVCLETIAELVRRA